MHIFEGVDLIKVTFFLFAYYYVGICWQPDAPVVKLFYWHGTYLAEHFVREGLLVFFLFFTFFLFVKLEEKSSEYCKVKGKS